MYLIRKIKIVLFLVFLHGVLSSQNATIKGVIRNEVGQAVEFANISVESHRIGTTSDRLGRFEMKVPADKNITVNFSFISYMPVAKELFLSEGEVFDKYQRICSLLNNQVEVSTWSYNIKDVFSLIGLFIFPFLSIIIEWYFK